MGVRFADEESVPGSHSSYKTAEMSADVSDGGGWEDASSAGSSSQAESRAGSSIAPSIASSRTSVDNSEGKAAYTPHTSGTGASDASWSDVSTSHRGTNTRQRSAQRTSRGRPQNTATKETEESLFDKSLRNVEPLYTENTKESLMDRWREGIPSDATRNGYTARDFSQGLSEVKPLYTEATRNSVLGHWRDGIPSDATKNGYTATDFSKGLERLDNTYAASGYANSIGAWSRAVSEAEDDDSGDSNRSVMEDRWDQALAKTGQSSGAKPPPEGWWSGTQGFDLDGKSTVNKTSNVFFNIPGNGTRGSTKFSYSPKARRPASAGSYFPTRTDPLTSGRPAVTTRSSDEIHLALGILKNNKRRNRTAPRFSTRQSATSPSRYKMESWQIKSAMSTIATDMHDWQSRASKAISRRDNHGGDIDNSIAMDKLQTLRGAQRQLEETTGRPITEHDYISELQKEKRTITEASVRWDATMLDLEQNDAARWYDDASRYESKGDHHMRDFCTKEGDQRRWHAEEMGRVLDAKKSFLSRQGHTVESRPYSAFNPGSMGFVVA